MTNKSIIDMKKVLFIPLFLVLVSIFVASSCNNQSKEQKLTPAQLDSIKQAQEDSTRIADSIAAVQKHFEDSIKRANDSIEHIKAHVIAITNIYEDFKIFTVSDVSDIHEFYNIVDRGASILRDEKNPKIKRELKQKLIAYRVKNYPLARKAWAQSAKNRLWSQDIDVSYNGRTITFTGAVFASNSGIKEVYDNIKDALCQLHFKRCNFKWYKYDDEYTYYTINSSEDNEVYE